MSTINLNSKNCSNDGDLIYIISFSLFLYSTAFLGVDNLNLKSKS